MSSIRRVANRWAWVRLYDGSRSYGHYAYGMATLTKTLLTITGVMASMSAAFETGNSNISSTVLQMKIPLKCSFALYYPYTLLVFVHNMFINGLLCLLHSRLKWYRRTPKPDSNKSNPSNYCDSNSSDPGPSRTDVITARPFVVSKMSD